MMASDVDCACDEGKNENWQKGDHGGFELACMNPRCLCGRYSRRSWSHRRHILAACYFGVFEAKRTSRLFCYSRSPTTAGELPAHLGWYIRVIHLP